MNTRAAAAGLAVLAIVIGGIAYFATKGRHHDVSPGTTVTATTPPTTPTAAPEVLPEGPRQAYIYTVAANGGDDNGLAREKVDVKNPGSPTQDVLHALVDAPNSPLPEGTRILGVRIEKSVATVDFSSEFKKNFHGGD